MCKESKRLTAFKPKKLTNKQKKAMQNGMLVTYKIDTNYANSLGLSQYESKRNNGAWEYQNYVENFGEDEVETV